MMILQKQLPTLLIAIALVFTLLKFSHAETPDVTGKNETKTPELSFISQEINILKQKLELKSDKSDLISLKEDISNREDTNQNAFSSNLLAALAIILAIIGVAGAFISRFATTRAVDRASKMIDGKIKQAVLDQKMSVETAFYTNLSYSYFSLNNPDISKIIKCDFSGMEPEKINSIRSNCYVGNRIAKFGLDLFEKDHEVRELEKIDEEKFDQRMKRFRLNLLNNFVFSKTLELIADKSLGKDVSDEAVENLIDAAEECRIAVNNVPQDNNWFEIYDSAIFALVKHGDELASSRGLKFASQICEGWKPSSKHCDVPSDRIELFKSDYLS